jgi:hypothetical protein
MFILSSLSAGVPLVLESFVDASLGFVELDGAVTFQFAVVADDEVRTELAVQDAFDVVSNAGVQRRVEVNHVLELTVTDASPVEDKLGILTVDRLNDFGEDDLQLCPGRRLLFLEMRDDGDGDGCHDGS